MGLSDNLNNHKIPTDRNSYVNQEDYSIRVSNCEIEVIFRNQKNRLLELIAHYPYVVGCVAWLTDLDILYAMSKMKHVSIIVQKEDFLRPDLTENSNWKQELKQYYNSLPSCFNRYAVEGLVSTLSYRGDTTLDSVRCVGSLNIEKNHSFPRMHNKFLIFTHGKNGGLGVSKQSAVWTGSCNLSANSIKSFENVLVIHTKRCLKLTSKNGIR